ncbi:MAG: LytR C-terminal domain-containing protein [Candidatus Cloacimonetes bacterium]|nr:LytR C-terminal domain-containing protein [Candidatus Cloacimonadota bacterium]
MQVLNGCGKKGLARVVRNVLIEKGFDVLSFDNAEKFLYEKTVIVIRHMNYEKFDILYKEVPVKKIYRQINELSIYDFTVIIGKDYKKIFGL